MDMNTRLQQLVRFLVMTAWLMAAGGAAADWPGDIGPKQQRAKATVVDSTWTEKQKLACESTYLNV